MAKGMQELHFNYRLAVEVNLKLLWKRIKLSKALIMANEDSIPIGVFTPVLKDREYFKTIREGGWKVTNGIQIDFHFWLTGK